MGAELRHIAAFLAVARCGNFTRAATELHVSQPALTVQIRQLEAALGLRLFDRNNRNVALTQPGRELVAPFERVLLEVRSIVEHAHDVAAHRRGVITVACLPSIAAGLLPRAIAELAVRHQGISARVRDVVSARVVELVKSGEVDFGLGICGRADRDLTEEPLFVDRLAAFVPKSHPLAGKRDAALRDIAAHPLILTGRDSSVRELVERALEQQQVPVTVAQEASYMTTALEMAAAGLGIAILPDIAITSSSVAVRRVGIRQPVLTRRIGIITKAGRSLSPAAQKLVELLRRSGKSSKV
jgi:DNA-binding transcriptional LysR family regulator